MSADSCIWAPPNGAQIRLFTLELIADTASYGVFFAVIVMSTYILVRKGLGNSTPRLIFLCLSLLMFLISSIHLPLHILYFTLQLPYNCTFGPADQAKFNYMLAQMWASIECLERAQYLLGDIIVVWRAWVLWQQSIWARVFLAISLLGTASTSIFLAVINVLQEETGRQYSDLERNLTGTFGLLFTNAAATILIAYKTWIYRRSVKHFLSRGSSRAKTENTLILIIESGAIYCVYWILMLVGDFGYYVDFKFEWFQPSVAGIYPTIIMLLVAVQRSMADSMFSLSERSGADESMAFAPAPIYVPATRRGTLGQQQQGLDASVSGSGSSVAVDGRIVGDQAKIESVKQPVSSP